MASLRPGSRRDRIGRSPNGPHSPMRPRCQCDSVRSTVTSTCCRSRTRRLTLGVPRRRGDLGNALARLLVAALKARGNAAPMRGLAILACVVGAISALGLAFSTFMEVSMYGFPDGHVTDYEKTVDAPLTRLAGGFRFPISGPRLYTDRHPVARRRTARRPDRVRPRCNGCAWRRPLVFRNPSRSR
jgi:hypothetical protein